MSYVYAGMMMLFGVSGIYAVFTDQIEEARVMALLSGQMLILRELQEKR